MRIGLSLIGTLTVTCSLLLAQTNTGSIGGIVTDTTGAVMVAVKVEIVNTGTGVKRAVETNEVGQFLAPSLPPGTYELTAERQGFKRLVRNDIKLSVQDALEFNLEMSLGSVTDAIEVKGEVTQLQTATSSLGQVVDNRKIVDMPLNGRNTLALVELTAGVQPGTNFGGLVAIGNAYTQGNFSVSGAPGYSSSVILDGVSVDQNLYSAPSVVPSIDAVEQFKVQTNSFSAEFGRTGGGVVNVIMKSGTNQLRGNAYEFLRNRVLDANTFFNNASGAKKSVYTYNLFGATVGGPVVLPGMYNGKDRTFFFSSYEGFRNRAGVSSLMTIPSTAQRGGDFSNTYTATGAQIGIYDPLTAALNSSTGVYSRTAFAGNVIPASRFDPVAKKAIAYYPTPNLPGTALTGTYNYLGTGAITNKSDQVNERVDHSFSPAHHMFGRYSMTRANRGSTNVFSDNNPFGGFNPSGGYVDILIKGQQFVLNDTLTPSPTFMVDLSYGVSREWVTKQPKSWGRSLTELGFPASYAAIEQRYFPNITISDFRALQASDMDLIRRGDYTHSFRGTVTKLAGRHAFKFGAEYRLMRISEFQQSDLVFGFTRSFTGQNPFATATNSGAGMASFLLGDAASGTSNVTPALAIQSHYLAGYVQDDIRLNSKLTLNLGFRYDVETPRTERYDRLNWFDFAAASPLAATSGISGLVGGLAFVGTNGKSRQQQVLDANNFGPRFGFAYSVDSKTVIRSGYGIFYVPVSINALGSSVGSQGYSTSTSMVTTLDSGITPYRTLSDPFPDGLNRPSGNTLGLATLAGQSIRGIDRNSRVGYVQQYNFNIQRQLPGDTLLDLAYAGSHSLKLFTTWNADQLNPTLYTMGSTLQTQVTNPFRGLIALGSLSNATVSRAQLLLPYPQFTGVTGVFAAGASNYQSLQVKVEHRMASGLTYLLAYTFAKNIGDSNPVYGETGGGYQNTYDRRSERSLLPTDISHRFVGSYTYELPFGKGKRWGAHWSRFTDLIAGGWQVNGITTVQVGMPLIVTLSSSNTYGGTRPNSTGASARLDRSDRTPRKWFNTAAFTLPPAYSLGNVSRTLPDVRAPGIGNVDISLFKNIPLNDRVRLQFRAEAFNVANHTRFSTPSTSFGSSTFGQISATGDPRMMQMALKLNF
jgi:hypothetical protein